MKDGHLYQKDYWLLRASVKGTLVIIVVCILGMMFGDSIGAVTGQLIGVAATEIETHSILTEVKSFGWTLYLSPVVLFMIFFAGLNYLQYECKDGTFTIPYKRDYDGNLVKKEQVTSKETRESCYHRTQDRVRTHQGIHCGNCGKRF